LGSTVRWRRSRTRAPRATATLAARLLASTTDHQSGQH
jgi:hypothetical protein